jgi:hypothetical protein
MVPLSIISEKKFDEGELLLFLFFFLFFLKEGFPPISNKEINIYKVFHLTHTSSQGTRVFETTRMAGVGGKSNKGRTLSIQSKPC